MKISKKEIFTIPNILTYLRILLVPVFICFMLLSKIPNNIMWAFGIFVFASVTDLVDGYIARKFNMVSDLGKLIDPFADKFLQVSALICLTAIGYLHYAFFIILLVKELYLITAGVALRFCILKKYNKTFIIAANIYGKMAALLIALGVVMCFFHPYYVQAGIGSGAYTIDFIVLTFAIIASVIAGVNYTYQAVKNVKHIIAESNASKSLAE